MSMQSRVRHNHAIALLFTGLLIPVAVQAQSLNLDAAPCAKTIRIDAQDVPLGEVLQRLSGSLDFRLHAKVELPEPVTIRRSDTPEALLKHLMQGRNLVMESAPNKKCAGRDTLATVWVLPAGEAVPRLESGPQPAGRPPVIQEAGDVEYRALRPERPRGTRKRMSEEEWQKMKEEYKAGRIKADPETGLPVPVDGKPAAPDGESAEAEE
jgi:hypothetical protein